MMFTAAIACCLSLSLPLFQAQEADSLRPGMRLRVASSAVGEKRIVGTVTAVDSSVLTIQTSKKTVALPRDSFREVEISTRRSWRRTGALIGAGVGLAVAIILAARDEQEPFLTQEPLYGSGAVGLMDAILLVPAGAGLGALVAPGERWAPMSAARVEPARGASRGRAMQVALRIRF